jgi:hypothetical protein
MKTARCAFFRRPLCLGVMLLWTVGLVRSAVARPDALTQGPSQESDKLGFLLGTIWAQLILIMGMESFRMVSCLEGGIR